MKKSAVMVGVLLMGLSSSPSYSEDGFKVFGGGLSSCGQWVKAANEKPSVGGRSHDFVVSASWVQGYLSGYGHLLLDRNQEIRSIDNDALELFITQYCLANPLDLLVNPTMLLSKELTIDK